MAQGIKNPLHYGIPARLRRARKLAGIAVTALARRADLSPKVAQLIEAGGVPRLDVVAALARVLGVAPGWLAYGPQQAPRRDDGAAEGQGHLGVGERLRAVREEAGVTRTALGRAAGLTGMAVTHIEEGRSVPSVATAEQLADSLGVAPSWLAFGERPPLGRAA